MKKEDAMTRDDIISFAMDAQLGNPYGKGSTGTVYVNGVDVTAELMDFAALVAAEKEQQMIRDGWRKCAEGQRTTQFCGLLDAAVKAEREACAKENAELLQALQNLHQRCHWADAPEEMDAAKAAIDKAIRARGEQEQPR